MAAYTDGEATVDDVFRALADASRRQLLDSLDARNGQTLRQLCAGLDMARQSVSKHLTVLEGANLVTTVWHGREKLHYLNPAPIAELSQRWISRYDQPRVNALTDLKKALEGTPMSKPEFVYTTYIRTTPQQLWQALTDPAFTRRYWAGQELESDWRRGSAVTYIMPNGARIEDPDQIVLESDPYRRLAYTWHTFTPEWADAFGQPEDLRASYAAEPRSTATFDIEDLGEMVKLTVRHDGFDGGSAVFEGISQGWPLLLAGLKSLLETGDVLTAG
jgi:uncharacterized protein YndB with AHSA1/START domain/DNA-binding transcriptional ArsR family regulator